MSKEDIELKWLDLTSRVCEDAVKYRRALLDIKDLLEQYLIGNLKFKDSQYQFERLLNIINKAIGDKGEKH